MKQKTDPRVRKICRAAKELVECYEEMYFRILSHNKEKARAMKEFKQTVEKILLEE